MYEKRKYTDTRAIQYQPAFRADWFFGALNTLLRTTGVIG
jgi:hypothetical protein